jgi:hypothetical protein
MDRGVAGHGSVAQQSRPKEIVREPPKQCWVSKPLGPEVDLPLFQNCTYVCQRVWIPLASVQWIMFSKSISKAYLPATVFESPIAVITMQAMFTTRKMITRKININLDPWYMACNRAIMMASSMFQSSQYHWDIAAHHPTWQLQPHLSHLFRSTQYCLKQTIRDHPHTGINTQLTPV